jgi:hypothetical protein
MPLRLGRKSKGQRCNRKSAGNSPLCKSTRANPRPVSIKIRQFLPAAVDQAPVVSPVVLLAVAFPLRVVGLLAVAFLLRAVVLRAVGFPLLAAHIPLAARILPAAAFLLVAVVPLETPDTAQDMVPDQLPNPRPRSRPLRFRRIQVMDQVMDQDMDQDTVPARFPRCTTRLPRRMAVLDTLADPAVRS